jgi:HAD superfamily hydrolase (TIGR01509 family)
MTLKPGAALLFDIDGTMVESDPLHLAAFNQVFAPYGHTFDQARFSRDLQGRTNLAIGAQFLPGETAQRQAEVLEHKEALFRDMASSGIEPVHGLIDLLDWAEATGIPVIAVTNAPRANADLLLESIGVRQRLPHVVIAAELAHGKPHPLPYLEGLRLLGGRAEHAVAFEDSRAGVTSATSAGIATVGLATGLAPEDLRDAGADLAIRDYTDPLLRAFITARLFA